MIHFDSGIRAAAFASKILVPALAATLLAACASTSTVAPTATAAKINATLPLKAAAALQKADKKSAYVPPVDSPTATLHFERPEELGFNLANVHLDNENCAARREFVGEPASDSFRGAIAANGEITVSTWSDATWVGPQPFDIEFCNAIFTFTPLPGESYFVARPQLENDCRVDVFRTDGAIVDVEMRQPVSSQSDNGAWCQARLPGSLGKTNAPKLLVNLPGIAGPTNALFAL